VSAEATTLGALLGEVTASLAAAGLPSARAEARWLLEEAAGLEPGRLALAAGEPAAAGVGARVLAMAGRRAAGEPLQYVLGWAPFGPLRLAVGPGVFVPRPETELLAERAAAHLRAAGGAERAGERSEAVHGRPPEAEAPVALDLCTGSGAVACYLAGEVPGATVVATELDPAAASFARRNGEPLGVRVLVGDLDAPVQATLPELAGRVAVLTANVPYVPSGQLAGLPADVREHEPAMALDGGAEGLDVLGRVLALAGRWLAPNGWILCEIGEDQGAAATAMAARAGLVNAAVRPDLAGRDRIVEAQWRAARSSRAGMTPG
jgi:release factor glutamine methyltransferase